jgi:F-type H+-transporting ATPase subunit a
MKVDVHLAAETLFHIGPIPVTNSMLMMFIVMAVLIIVGQAIARRAQLIPGRAQGAFEMIVEFLLGIIEGTAGKRSGRRLFPLVGGLFIFIIFANYSGLLPGVGTIGTWHHEAGNTKVLVPFFRGPDADLNMTLAMAFLTFFVVQVVGIQAHGVVGRIKHLADPWWIFPLEVVQELARIISLSFRLFGNIFAGETLLAVMYAMANAIKIAIVPLAIPVVFLFLELLFGFIQALVFALLTLVYIVIAVGGDHEEGEHQHAAEPGVASSPAAPVPGVGD